MDTGQREWRELDAVARRVNVRIADAVNRLLDSTAPLYQPDARKQPSAIGSGVFFRIREHRFLVSAAHVCDRASPHYPISAGTVRSIEDLGFRWRSPRMDAPLASGREDIAVFELGPMEADGYDSTPFLTLDDFDPYPPSEEECSRSSYLVIGYPRTLQPRQATGATLQPVPRPLVTMSRNFAEYPALGIAPDTHLLLSYDRRGFHSLGPSQEEPDPHGMSGGGVWRLDGLGSSGTITTKLVGILIEYHARAPSSLVATRVNALLGALRKVRPDLKPLIDIHFPFAKPDAA